MSETKEKAMTQPVEGHGGGEPDAPSPETPHSCGCGGEAKNSTMKMILGQVEGIGKMMGSWWGQQNEYQAEVIKLLKKIQKNTAHPKISECTGELIAAPAVTGGGISEVEMKLLKSYIKKKANSAARKRFNRAQSSIEYYAGVIDTMEKRISHLENEVAAQKITTSCLNEALRRTFCGLDDSIKDGGAQRTLSELFEEKLAEVDTETKANIPWWKKYSNRK